MASIFQHNASRASQDKQQALKNVDQYLRDLHNVNSKRIDISKIKKDVVKFENGQTITISPAKIAYITNIAIDIICNDKNYSFLKPFLTKPIIWTYEAKTAFTDGIRIYISPAFAYMLIMKQGKREQNAYINSLNVSIDEFKRNERQVYKANVLLTKYIRFVIVHECYHILYNHVRRAALIYGIGTESDRLLGNKSMDLEINRDIESTFKDLEGSTKVINGIWYKDPEYLKKDNKPFNNDIWEDIWTYWKDNNIEPGGQPTNPFNNENVNPTAQEDNNGNAFKSGWNKAIDAIKNGLIDPRNFSIEKI